MNRNQLIENLMMQVAMWADENLFGHGLDDDAYEELCERLADDLHQEIYETLTERPVR